MSLDPDFWQNNEKDVLLFSILGHAETIPRFNIDTKENQVIFHSFKASALYIRRVERVGAAAMIDAFGSDCKRP